MKRTREDKAALTLIITANPSHVKVKRIFDNWKRAVYFIKCFATQLGISNQIPTVNRELNFQ